MIKLLDLIQQILNDTYYVTDVANDTTFTVTVNGLSPGNIPSADLANAIVKG